MANGGATLPRLVAVAHGKGGVGKSTVAVNLAVALSGLGHRVGLLDADVHGPDVLRLLGLTRRADAPSVDLWRNPRLHRRLTAPVDVHGVRVVSLQMLIGEGQDFSAQGFTWMLLDRLLRQTTWGDTELIVLDLPPGTGEVTTHLLRAAPPTGVLLVVTPQDVAHLDARKLLTVLRRHHAPVLGGVENMAPMRCPCCDAEIPLFPEPHTSGAFGGTVLRSWRASRSPRRRQPAKPDVRRQRTPTTAGSSETSRNRSWHDWPIPERPDNRYAISACRAVDLDESSLLPVRCLRGPRLPYAGGGQAQAISARSLASSEGLVNIGQWPESMST